MADVQVAITYVMEWEDATGSGVITTARDGKRTRFGIDERYHPELTNSLFYTTMGKEPALIIAKAIYETSYADPLCLNDIANQDIANKLLSLGVNMGIRPASKLLQDALGVDGDGRIGPITLHVLDCAKAPAVLQSMRFEASYFYTHLAEEHPEYQVDLQGWLRRAEA